jgi:hypothetical protein
MGKIDGIKKVPNVFGTFFYGSIFNYTLID